MISHSLAQATRTCVSRALAVLAMGVAAASAVAQGPTTAAIGGRVVDASGRALVDVEVVVTNQATGVSMRGVSRSDGRYLVSGLEVGVRTPSSFGESARR